MHSLVQRPERQRRHIFDEHPIARDGRLRPCLVVRDGIAMQRFETGVAAPPDNQLAIILETEQQITGASGPECAITKADRRQEVLHHPDGRK